MTPAKGPAAGRTDAGHVLVTGASSGIGEALARVFATGERRLTVVARRKDRLDGLAAELPVPVHVVAADLAQRDAGLGWVDEAEAAHGPIDVLVLNAGVQYVEPALGVGAARAASLFELNLLAPVRLAERIVPGMVARGGGAVVVVASVAALVNTPGMAHYNASKAGVAAYFETLRDELRGTGVSVLVVYPGPVATPMERAARERLGASAAADRMPTGTPEALAALIRRGVERGSARIVYPRVYGAVRFARGTAQWFTSHFTPKV